MSTEHKCLELPPLPEPEEVDNVRWAYTSDSMRSYALDAIAPYANRIEELERELEQARAAFIGSENARKDAEKAAKLQEIADLGQEIEGGPAWVSASKQLPEPGETVLVISESWQQPEVLKYQVAPHQRFLDAYHGRWYWYPERMHWMRIAAAPTPTSTGREEAK